MAAAASVLMLAGLVVPPPAASVASLRTVVTHAAAVVAVPGSGAAVGQAITVPESGMAAPYPGTAPESLGGTVTDVNVTLMGLDHARPSDLDVMLVSPDGRVVTVVSDAGGDVPVSGVNLTLDDEADFSLSDSGGFTTGSYTPTNYGVADAFPAPAPAQPTGFFLALSLFDGAPVAGVWQLYVVDDTGGVSGSLTNWYLTFTRTSPTYPSELVVGSDVGTVTDLDVHLDGLAMGVDGALDVMLIGPQGQRTTIFSDAGESPGLTETVDLVLDDEAMLPAPSPLFPLLPGRYRPTNLGASDFFPPPAPPDNGTADLSLFDGTDPRGVWQLWVAPNGLGFGRIESWSLDFEWTDASAPTGTFAIADGAAITTDPDVPLRLAATDPSPASGVARARFSNDGVSWSSFQPYADLVAWTLPGDDGTKTVYAQFEDAAGNVSAVVSDTIALDTQGPRSLGVRPKAKSKHVRRGVMIVVKVSEALQAASVTKKTVVLMRRGRPGRVKAKVRYDAGTMRIVLDPRRKLAAGAKYRVTVSTGVVDVAGHPWDQSTALGAQSLTWAFRTR